MKWVGDINGSLDKCQDWVESVQFILFIKLKKKPYQSLEVHGIFAFEKCY